MKLFRDCFFFGLISAKTEIGVAMHNSRIGRFDIWNSSASTHHRFVYISSDYHNEPADDDLHLFSDHVSMCLCDTQKK